MNYIIIIVIVIVVLSLLLSVSAYFVLNSKPELTPTPIPVTTPVVEQEDYELAITQAPKPTYIPRPTAQVTTTLRPRVTVPPTPSVSERLPDSIKDLNDKFAWQTMQNVGERDQTELTFLKTCTKPWDATYQVGCTIDGITYKSKKFGPVFDNNKQAPRLRIGDYGGNNICTKNNGTLSIFRQRPGDENMIDITQFLKDTTGSKMYNRKDALVVDDYLGDC